MTFFSQVGTQDIHGPLADQPEVSPDEPTGSTVSIQRKLALRKKIAQTSQ